MTQLEESLEVVISIFHQYSVRTGDFDTLSKGELKQLITKELASSIENTKDQATIDKIFQDLDADRDGQVDFNEFVPLVVQVLKTAHVNIHRE